MRIFTLIFFLTNFLCSPTSWAEEISYGTPVSINLKNGNIWEWKVDLFEGQKILIVEEKGKHSGELERLLEADISDCFFCDGEEDNCTEDGIAIVELETRPSPSLSVVCHVGAHSQRLMIFDPSQDKHSPVLTRTGAYWLQTTIFKDKISFSHDKSGFGSSCPNAQPSINGICELQESWP